MNGFESVLNQLGNPKSCTCYVIRVHHIFTFIFCLLCCDTQHQCGSFELRAYSENIMASDKNQVNVEEKVEEPLLQNTLKKNSTKVENGTNEEDSIRDKLPQVETKRTKSKSNMQSL